MTTNSPDAATPRLSSVHGTGAREAEGSGLLSRPVSDGSAGSNPAPSVLVPPYRFVSSFHGPATIHDGIDVGWVARIKESLPFKNELAAIIVRLLNRASEWDGGETCDDCGLLVAPHTGAWWHADDELWMEVVEPPETYEAGSGRTIGVGVLCPPCFTARCDAKGIRIFWHARVEYRVGEDIQEAQRRAGLRV